MYSTLFRLISINDSLQILYLSTSFLIIQFSSSQFHPQNYCIFLNSILTSISPSNSLYKTRHKIQKLKRNPLPKLLHLIPLILNILPKIKLSLPQLRQTIPQFKQQQSINIVLFVRIEYIGQYHRMTLLLPHLIDRHHLR